MLPVKAKKNFHTPLYAILYKLLVKKREQLVVYADITSM